MTKTLIRNATVLSMDPHVGEIECGDVLIEGERISAVGEKLDAKDVETIDAAGMILMPGLVNAHMHTWQTALRGLGGDWGGRSYFEIAHETLAPRYRPEDIYIATLTGAWSQMEAGVTTLFDWCHNNPTPEHTDAGIDALEESGIRALFGHGTPKPKPKESEPHYSQIPHPEIEIKRLRVGRLASDEGLITLAMAILGADYSPWKSRCTTCASRANTGSYRARTSGATRAERWGAATTRWLERGFSVPITTWCTATTWRMRNSG